MKNKVLILGVSAVQYDAILELNRLGYETYACAMAKDGLGADAADHFEPINFMDKESVIKYVIENEISTVYSVGSDLAVPVSSSISELLHLPHFVSEETAMICNNKSMMRNSLGTDFKGNLRFQLLSSLDERVELEYPFILKPVDSQGQRGVVLVTSIRDYTNNFASTADYSRSGRVIIEQYIQGRELSVNGYMVNGELKYLVASDRVTWPEYIGLIHKHVVPAADLPLETIQEITRIIESACEKLGIRNGPVYVQMKLEKGAPYIIEITPRLDGCHLWQILHYHTGVNLLKLAFEHLLKNDSSELNHHYDEFKDGYTLEFICQKPNTKADYSGYQDRIADSLTNFNYYTQGENVRPVNGKFEKIGYFIYHT